MKTNGGSILRWSRAEANSLGTINLGEKQSNKLLEQQIKKPLKEGYGAAFQRRKSSRLRRTEKSGSEISARLQGLDEGSYKVSLYKAWKTIHLNWLHSIWSITYHRCQTLGQTGYCIAKKKRLWEMPKLRQLIGNGVKGNKGLTYVNDETPV